MSEEEREFLETLRAVAASTRARQDATADDWAALLTLFEQLEARRRQARGEDGFDGA